MNYDYIDAGHPDSRHIRITTPDGAPIPHVFSAHVSKSELGIYNDNLTPIIYKMEFNLVDIRTNAVIAKGRLYSPFCVCGAHKTIKAGPGNIGHSDWCGWAIKKY